jgi:hypothetical protein
MRQLARAGVLVLARSGSLSADGRVSGGPVVEIDGLAVAGYDDPLENPTAGVRTRSLELAAAELEREAAWPRDGHGKEERFAARLLGAHRASAGTP